MLSQQSQPLSTGRIAADAKRNSRHLFDDAYASLDDGACAGCPAADALRNKKVQGIDMVATPRVPGDDIHLLGLSSMLQRLGRLQELVAAAQQPHVLGMVSCIIRSWKPFLHVLLWSPGFAFRAHRSCVVNTDPTRVVLFLAVRQAPANTWRFKPGGVT